MPQGVELQTQSPPQAQPKGPAFPPQPSRHEADPAPIRTGQSASPAPPRPSSPLASRPEQVVETRGKRVDTTA